MTSPEFERWLKRATKRLPTETAVIVREELTAHYEDAVADYLAEGKTQQEAQRAALLALGDEGEVSEGFQQTHFAGRRYLMAAAVGMTYPAVYLLSIPFNQYFAGVMVFNPAIFLPLIYVVYGFKTLLAHRPHGTNLTPYENIVHTGIVAMCVPRLFAWLIYHQPMIAEAYAKTFGEAHSTGEFLLNAIAVFGLFLTSIGCVMLGERALHLPESLFGLLKPAGGLVMFCGGCLALYCLGTLTGSIPVREMSEMIAVVTGMIAVVLWAVIFFRARSEMVEFA